MLVYRVSRYVAVYMRTHALLCLFFVIIFVARNGWPAQTAIVTVMHSQPRNCPAVPHALSLPFSAISPCLPHLFVSSPPFQLFSWYPSSSFTRLTRLSSPMFLPAACQLCFPDSCFALCIPMLSDILIQGLPAASLNFITIFKGTLFCPQLFLMKSFVKKVPTPKLGVRCAS